MAEQQRPKGHAGNGVQKVVVTPAPSPALQPAGAQPAQSDYPGLLTPTAKPKGFWYPLLRTDGHMEAWRG